MNASTQTRTSAQDAIVANMIRLADFHRDHCHGESCDVSLSLFVELFRLAGISLAESEEQHFL